MSITRHQTPTSPDVHERSPAGGSQLGKNPVFSCVAILTLGLGIVVNPAIFSAAEQTFRPTIPFNDPDGLVRIYQVPETGSPNISPRVPVFLEIRDGPDLFERVAASRFTGLTLTTADGPQRVVGNAVTPEWLRTRALARDAEFAPRASLGATRGRLLAQTLTESAVLGIAGGVAGVGIAALGIFLLEPLLPSRLVDIGARLSVNGSALGFAVWLAVVTGLLVGLLPALRLSSANASATLRRGSRGLTGKWGGGSAVHSSSSNWPSPWSCPRESA